MKGRVRLAVLFWIGFALIGGEVEDGLLLLGELGCVNCHRSTARLDAHQGPVLTGAGSRLRKDYLAKLLRGGVTAGRMPHMARLTEPEAAALSALIASSRTQGEQPLPPGSAERGRQFFARTGCAACHGVTVASAAGKYLPGALAAFLLDPLAVRPSARMPRFALEPAEAADLEAYLADAANRNAADGAASPAATNGRPLFASSGCANCHEFALRPQQQPVAPTVHALPAAALATRLDRGCLDPANLVTPRYTLSAAEREALRAALRAVGAGYGPGRASEPQFQLTAPARLDLRLAALNCTACHARNGKGGPAPGRQESFTVLADTDLGDEGRLPPPLTAIGYKLTPEALREAIEGKTRVHPQMSTRMPDYGPSHAEALVREFAAVDLPPEFKPGERVGRNAAGRELVGLKGLGCINCHNLRGRKSLGIGASDLALAPQRLRAEWFRDFLIDPARFHPGTRMPSFWPGGVATNKQVSRGNVTAQIDSIWVYLTEIDQTRLPVGLEEKGAFELKPGDRPIVLRAFMKDAGTHAVAVGFPGQINAAFDSNESRWAIVWRGRFVDAESVWEDRFNPPMSPLGTDVVVLRRGESGSSSARFRGYRLDARGVPAFLYDIDGAQIADSLAPSPDGRGFIRTVEVDTGKPFVFRPAMGPLQVRGDRSSGQGIPLSPGRHTLRMELTW